ncbi:MAG: hypothetical protein IAX22_04860 [Candidatus Bathyarchaeota archaeon]|nr:hypothetical protein [Candidatus Bathyarchaeota archaeon]
MTTGIRVKDSKDITITDGSISGLDKGIEVINSSVELKNTKIRKCKVAIELTESHGIIDHTIFNDNDIDIIVKKADITLIDTYTEKLVIFAQNNRRIFNPMIVKRYANKIKRTKDLAEKRKQFKKLLKYAKTLKYVWTVYCILKEIAQFLGL